MYIAVTDYNVTVTCNAVSFCYYIIATATDVIVIARYVMSYQQQIIIKHHVTDYVVTDDINIVTATDTM